MGSKKDSARLYEPPRSPLSNRTYDILKYIAQIVLPGLGALYFGLAQIWGFPNAEEVVGTLSVIDVFLGLLLGQSAKVYNKSPDKYDGALVVDTSDETKDIYSFEVDEPLETIREKDQLVLKVRKPYVGPRI